MRAFFLALLPLTLAVLTLPARAESVARQWNEANLNAIRLDFPAPTVHARNLFHTSVAMWDAWAAYDFSAVGYCHNEWALSSDIESARDEAISYAAYRVLYSRYLLSVNAPATTSELDALMANLGYDKNITTTVGSTPAAIGNRVAASVLAFAASDGSRETTFYDDPSYAPVNDPLILANSGTTMSAPNRWQPLAFAEAQTQNGQEADEVQVFVGSHWGDVRPFALHLEEGEDIYHDPGDPPYFGGVGDADFKTNNVEVLEFSSYLDPDDGVLVDISPGASGNNTLGQNNGTGFSINPMTGLPYAPNVVKRGDFGRVMAEFWADGPQSETPPGHWNTIANDTVDHPLFERRFKGYGPELDPLEWDVKMYLALNGALHDVAISVWWCKAYYDYVRPISSIRYLAQLGQSSNPSGINYNPNGIPLVSDLIEEIDSITTAPGGKHEHLAASLGKIAVNVWPGEPADPETQYSGKAWIVAEDWLPYQRDTFVTPAFAGYVSGHSGFSRAGAEVLTRMTGNAFFPGGFFSYTYAQGELEFELGPSTDVELQWATYYDAADQAGISRLYGGIHVAADDGPGRIIGSECGIDSWDLAVKYYDGSILSEPLQLAMTSTPPSMRELSWNAERGLYYKVQKHAGNGAFADLGPPTQALEDVGTVEVPEAGKGLFRVVRTPGP